MIFEDLDSPRGHIEEMARDKAIEAVARERAIKTIMQAVNGLQPGQAVTVRAHDVDKDNLYFTLQWEKIEDKEKEEPKNPDISTPNWMESMVDPRKR